MWLVLVLTMAQFMHPYSNYINALCKIVMVNIADKIKTPWSTAV